MSIKPVHIIAGICGLTVKGLVLLAVGLFIYDMIQIKKEERHAKRNRTA